MEYPTYSYGQLLYLISNADLPKLKLIAAQLSQDKKFFSRKDFSDLLIAISKRSMEIRLSQKVH